MPLAATFVLSLALAAGQPETDTPACRMVLRGANVWTGATFERRDLAVADGRLVATPIAGSDEIQAGWMYLIPPFADAHSHAIDRPVESFDRRSHEMLASGVFYALNPGNMLRHSDALGERIARPDTIDAIFAGPGITGSGGHPRRLYEGLVRANVLPGTTLGELPGNAFHEVQTPEEARAAVRRVVEAGAPVVKLHLLFHGTERSNGLSGEAFDAAVAEVRAAGRRAIAHVETAEDFRRAIRARVAAVMHLPGYVARPGDPPESYLLSDADARAAAEAGAVVVTTLSPAHNYASGEPLSFMRAIHAENLRRLRDAGVRLALGGDQYGSDLFAELNILNSYGLFTSSQLLAIATSNGAAFIFPDRRVGRLDAGYEASFLAYPFDPRGQLLRLDEPMFAVKSGRAVAGGEGILPEGCAPPVE